MSPLLLFSFLLLLLASCSDAAKQIPVAVSSALTPDQGVKLRLTAGLDRDDEDGWTHFYTFWAYDGPGVPGTFPVSLWYADDPWRHLVRRGEGESFSEAEVRRRRRSFSS